MLMATFCGIGPVFDTRAQDLGGYIESYSARLSPRDHFNSNGERLHSAAAIIRQDRANYYVYGLRDPEDEPDSFFSKKEDRALLEQMLERGRATPQVISAIVNGTPLIRVDIYETSLAVTLISE